MKDRHLIERLDTRGTEVSSAKDIHVFFELTDFCNEKCIMCKHSYSENIHGPYPKRFMEFGLFEKIVRDLNSSRFRITSIDPLWCGESLLHPNFKEMMRFLFMENQKREFFRGFVLNTNAVLMDEPISELFLDYAQYCQSKEYYFFKLYLSLEAIKPETYARIKNTPEANFARAMKNIEYFISRRKERQLVLPNLIFGFIVMYENYSEAKLFMEHWSDYLKDHSGVKYEVLPTWPLSTDRDSIYFRQLICNRPEMATNLHKKVAAELGIISARNERNKTTEPMPLISPIRKPCGALWRTPNITSGGIVTPCCRDVDLSLKIGDCNYENLSDMWYNERMTELRLAHIRGDLRKFPTCVSCIEPEGGVLSETEVKEYLESIGYSNEIESYLGRIGVKKDSSPFIFNCQKPTQKSLKICLVSREYPPDTAWGGIGTYTYELAQGLKSAGQEVHVICQSLESDREYTENGVYVHRITHKSIFPIKGKFREFALRWEYSNAVYKKLKEIIDKFDIDIVEAPNLSGEGFIYGSHKRTPLVTRLHTHFSEIIQFFNWERSWDRKLSCWFENAAILRSDLVTCSTKAHAELVSREIGIGADKIRIIPLGISIPELKEQEERRKPLTVLFVGRMEKRKGVHILIQAIPAVLKKIPDVRFVIIGRDSFISEDAVEFQGGRGSSYKEQLLRLIPPSLQKQVEFLGYVPKEELSKYYQSCDVFVAPSLYESFGLIYLEAMSYAKPVIGCGVGGVPEVIRDGETGQLVPPGDIQSLAQAILFFLQDRKQCERIGMAARRHVEMCFTQDIMVENTLNAYSQCLRMAERRVL
ncbi:MAG: glycosyltransferase [Candidatus Omnitrophota bacterium]